MLRIGATLQKIRVIVLLFLRYLLYLPYSANPFLNAVLRESRYYFAKYLRYLLCYYYACTYVYHSQ